ncbi:DoxX family protein [Nocardioides sp.]|uniref:DoxX family protein n=1 Tax=Nocardioides sp. TaxID=35761 RepID=UPI003564923F
MTLSRVIARPMLASMFLLGGVNALRNAQQQAERAKPVTDRLVPLAQKAAPAVPVPSDPVTLVRINAVAQVGAGLALATGRAPRLSAAVLAASLVPTTAAGHRFWEEQDPTKRAQQRVHFFKNLSIFGGLLIASGDTDGKPGVAWRARRAATDARKEARHLAASARREAKLAKAQLT